MAGRRCAYVHGSGKACGGFAIAGSTYCFAHDSGSAEQRAAARRRGGQAGRGTSVPESDVVVRSLADVVALIEQTVNDVRSGRVDVKIANAIGVLSNVALRAVERSAFEARLDALESVLEPERRRAVALRRRA